LNQPRAKKNSCVANSGSGAPCRAFAHGDGPFCIFHDPAYRESQRENSAKGGTRSGEARARRHDELLPIDLTTPQARIEVLGYILAGTLADRFSHAQSTAINRILSLATRHQEDAATFNPALLLELLSPPSSLLPRPRLPFDPLAASIRPTS
jgi:hypothetical protein